MTTWQIDGLSLARFVGRVIGSLICPCIEYARRKRSLSLRNLLKKLLFFLGLAWVVHAVRNRAVLTVVMFHRVLPPEDPRSAGANPTYTVSPDELARCLDFFARYYTIVGLDAVERAARGGTLPPRPLLITFDDGWRDNVEYALPCLAARGLPAVLFVATAYIGEERGFWQERVFDHMMTRAGMGSVGAEARIRELAALTAEARAGELALLEDRPLPRQMLDADELRRLQSAGVAVGGHGNSHSPLTDVVDRYDDIRICRKVLHADGLGGQLPSFSFPHGRFDDHAVDEVRAAGFGLCFTSEPSLARIAALADWKTIGRIGLDLTPFRRREGLDTASLAFSLITRPHSG